MCAGREIGRAVSADRCDFFDKHSLRNCPEGREHVPEIRQDQNFEKTRQAGRHSESETQTRGQEHCDFLNPFKLHGAVL